MKFGVIGFGNMGGAIVRGALKRGTLKKEDIKSTLLEPLYYTFKTKSQRYKASHFSVLDEVDDQIHSISGESVIHYLLWMLLVIVMILELCLFSPKVIGWHQNKNVNQQESVR